MILSLLTALSLAQPAPTPIVRGEDMVAWRALEERSAPIPSGLLQAFILDYPLSPLAELAWIRLRMRPEATAFSRRHRLLVQTLERSRIVHAERLAMPTLAWTPAAIDVSQEAPSDPADDPTAPEPADDRSWRLQTHAGAAIDDTGAAVALGLGLGCGMWTGLIRSQLGQVFNTELAVRIQPRSFGVLLVELGGDLRARGVARLGVSMPLTDRFHLESSMALAIWREGVDPVIRIELAGLWPLSKPPDEPVKERR